MTEYDKAFFCITVGEGPDNLTVSKDSGSDWCHLDMRTNDSENGHMVIRSKDMTAALHFALGQLLKRGKK